MTSYGSIPKNQKNNKNGHKNNKHVMHTQESISIRIRQQGPLLPRHVVTNADRNEEDEDDDEGSATIMSCVMNLINTIVGAGMLGLPGAFGGTGYVAGTVLICVGAAFSSHGLILLSKAAQEAGLPSSFYSVARAAVPEYTILIDFAVALKCFGVATGYLITVGDCMVDALDHLLLNGDPQHDNQWWISFVLSRRFWVTGGILLVLPTSFFRTLNELKKASALALVFVFFLAFGIVAYANGLADPCLDHDNSNDNDVCVGTIEPFGDGAAIISKLPIFVFSFTCHQNIFPIVNEIQRRSQARLNLIIFISIGFALVLFTTVALEGYFTFGSNVRGDILLNYPENFNVTILRICIAFMLSLHYPLQLDPSRRCITSLIRVVQQWRHGKLYQTFHRENSSIMDDSIKEDEPSESSLFHSNNNDSIRKSEEQWKDQNFMSDTTFYAITISFLFLSFLVAMVVDDLGIVLAMVGATGSTLVSYILPGLIYVKIHPTMDLSKIGAYVQLIVGCFIMPIALYFVLTGSVKH